MVAFLRSWLEFLRRGCKRKSADEEVMDYDEDQSFFFSIQCLEVATDNFSDRNLLGKGGFGAVYKGKSGNDKVIAVKKLLMRSTAGLQQFVNEVNLLLKVQHRNLVVLLGCCVEGEQRILVYEYLLNGSLDDILFDKSKGASLDWTKRMEIIQGVARGLMYLHEESPVRIVHRDIKASNILLDEQFSPKIGDFGISRLFPEDNTHLDTCKICGTYGYLAPEYALRGYLSVKADVFSFGVLVLEIISGRRNYDLHLDGNAQDLLSYAWRLWEQRSLLSLVDENAGECSAADVVLCIQIGLLCCQAKVSDRPTMFDVVQMLSSTYDKSSLPKPGKPGLQGRIGGGFTHVSTKSTSETSFFSDTSSAAAPNALKSNNTFGSITISFDGIGR